MHTIMMTSYPFNRAVSTPGLREHFASFLTDKEVVLVSCTCRVAKENLLINKVWIKRLIKPGEVALVKALSNQYGFELYERYVQKKIYEHGFARGLKAVEQFSHSVDVLKRLPPKHKRLDEDFKWLSRFAVTLVPLGCYFCIKFNHETFMKKDQFLTGLIFDIIEISTFFQIMILCLSSSEIPQKISGNIAILQVKGLRSIKHASTCYRHTNDRVSSCWQAFRRGVKRLHKWMWGGHEN